MTARADVTRGLWKSLEASRSTSKAPRIFTDRCAPLDCAQGRLFRKPRKVRQPQLQWRPPRKTKGEPTPGFPRVKLPGKDRSAPPVRPARRTMKTLFVAPYTPSAVDAIKFAALYFDEVVINERALVEFRPESLWTKRPIVVGETYALKGRIQSIVSTVDDSLREMIRPLIDEQVVRVEAEPGTELLRGRQRARLREEFGQARDLLYACSDRDDTQPSVGFLERGMDEIHTRFVGPLKAGAIFERNVVSTYFEGLFVESIGAALRGEAVLSSSPALYRLIERASTSPALKSPTIAEAFSSFVQPRLAMDVMQATLIDSSTLDCDEVLEARYQLRDELGAFRAELQRLQFDFTKEFGIDKVFREGRAIADARLTRHIREIEGKVRSGQIRVLRRLLEALEKPSAYLPLVGSIFAGLSLEIALALSLGLISARVALEAWEERKEIANDGLFYLVKTKSLIGSRLQSGEPVERITVDLDRRIPRDRVYVWPEDTVKFSDEYDEDYVLNAFRSMRDPE
jgi:hypothetical protein